jgi:hypothetical protein
MSPKTDQSCVEMSRIVIYTILSKINTHSFGNRSLSYMNYVDVPFPLIKRPECEAGRSLPYIVEKRMRCAQHSKTIIYLTRSSKTVVNLTHFITSCSIFQAANKGIWFKQCRHILMVSQCLCIALVCNKTEIWGISIMSIVFKWVNHFPFSSSIFYLLNKYLVPSVRPISPFSIFSVIYPLPLVK